MSKIILIFLLISGPLSVSAQTIFIGNKDIPETMLSKREIKDIFLGKKRRWQDNHEIRLAVMYASEGHSDFVREYLRKNSSQFLIYWKNKVFTGEGRFPKTFQSEDELIEYVAGNRGVIGYISSKVPVDGRIKIFNVLEN